MRKLLPIISHPGGRSALTCRFRCGDACFHEVSNTSANPYVGDVIAAAIGRRSLMRAAAVVTVAAAAGTAGLAGAEPAAASAQSYGKPKPGGDGARGLRFGAVAPNTVDAVVVPDGHAQNVVIRWGPGDSPAVEIDGSGKLPADGEFDGSGQWIPLATATADGAVSHVEGMSADEVFVFTRLAGDKVGATKMDRPEDIQPSPHTGKVYVALTNNSNRGVGANPKADEANPRNTNKHGHVLELTERHNRPESERFAWSLFLVAGDPDDPATYFAGFPKDAVSPISCPDNVAFDPHGNLWISTDGNQLGSHDGLFGVATRGERRGELKQFLTVPTGAETCGPVIQERRVLVAVQHPGEVDGASVENPASTWPDGPGRITRPAVVAVWRRDGRDIGV